MIIWMAAAAALAGCQQTAQRVFDFAQPAAPSSTPFQPLAATPTPAPVEPSVPASPVPSATAAATLTAQPSPTITPIACSAAPGRVEQVSRAGGAPLDYRIYLPPCYDLLADRSYPVLYILHGQTYNDDQWDRLGIDEAAEELILSRAVPPFIIVMPLEAETLADPFATRFGSHLAEELVPWVDAQYATCPERDCRAIGGLSRGGAWALNTGFTYWELFDSIGLHSTPPFLNDGYRLSDWLRDIPEGQLPRLWLDTGKQDWWLKYTVDFEDLLVRLNVPHEWYLFNGTHDEVYWSAHVGDYLAWYTAPWLDRFPKLP